MGKVAMPVDELVDELHGVGKAKLLGKQLKRFVTDLAERLLRIYLRKGPHEAPDVTGRQNR
ncbi:MAG: hypothetical protein WCJ40_08405 [Planctomycetota bacterium]